MYLSIITLQPRRITRKVKPELLSTSEYAGGHKDNAGHAYSNFFFADTLFQALERSYGRPWCWNPRSPRSSCVRIYGFRPRLIGPFYWLEIDMRNYPRKKVDSWSTPVKGLLYLCNLHGFLEMLWHACYGNELPTSPFNLREWIECTIFHFLCVCDGMSVAYNNTISYLQS